jgi:hypothetical protein
MLEFSEIDCLTAFYKYGFAAIRNAAFALTAF